MMKELSPLERAKRIFYLLYGREPHAGEDLTLGDSLKFSVLSKELSDWAVASGFEGRPV